MSNINILQKVLEGSQFVASSATNVKINEQKLDEFVSNIKTGKNQDEFLK